LGGPNLGRFARYFRLGNSNGYATCRIFNTILSFRSSWVFDQMSQQYSIRGSEEVDEDSENEDDYSERGVIYYD